MSKIDYRNAVKEKLGYDGRWIKRWQDHIDKGFENYCSEMNAAQRTRASPKLGEKLIAALITLPRVQRVDRAIGYV